MCNPMAMTGAVVGMFQANAENAAAMAEWRWRKQMEEMGTKSALEAMRLQYEQAGTKQMQERMSRGQEMAMIAKKAAAVKAAATVRAAKGGVSGESVDALTRQFESDALESIGIRKVEAKWADTMWEENKEAIQQQAQARIEGVQAPPKPSSSGRFMNTLSSMAQGALTFSSFGTGISPATTVPSTLPSSMVAPVSLTPMANLGVLDPMSLYAQPAGIGMSSALFGTSPLSIPSSYAPFNFGFDPFNLGALNLNSPFGSLQIGGSY